MTKKEFIAKNKDLVKEIFIDGVTSGMSEQFKQDFPDVGMGWDLTEEDLWEIYLKNNGGK